MLSFIDREDLIVLVKSGIRESVIKREFDVSDEEYNSILKSIDLRDELSKILQDKDSVALQKLIKKYRKKDCLIDYVACLAENKESEFLSKFDDVSRSRFNSLLEEYDIKLEKKEEKKKESSIGTRETYQTSLAVKNITDEEIEELRRKADKGTLNQKNIFAFILYKSGRIDESRDYLMGIIDSHKSYYAFRQLIHLEKEVGNLEDAKIWALEAEDQFPDNLGLKEARFRIARKEGNIDDMFSIAKEIRSLSPEYTRYEKEAERYKDKFGEEK